MKQYRVSGKNTGFGAKAGAAGERRWQRGGPPIGRTENGLKQPGPNKRAQN
jgi:hypothetical protein